LANLASQYVLILDGMSSERRQAYFASRPPKDVAYEYYAEKGIYFYDVNGKTLERLDDRSIVYTLDFEGPKIKY